MCVGGLPHEEPKRSLLFHLMERESAASLLTSIQGRRQAVRQGTLTPSSAGSNPAVPAIFICSGSSVGRATAF